MPEIYRWPHTSSRYLVTPQRAACKGACCTSAGAIRSLPATDHAPTFGMTRTVATLSVCGCHGGDCLWFVLRCSAADVYGVCECLVLNGYSSGPQRHFIQVCVCSSFHIPPHSSSDSGMRPLPATCQAASGAGASSRSSCSPSAS